MDTPKAPLARGLRVDRRVGLLLGGVLLLTFVALGASVALPATDESLRGREQKVNVRGMKAYRNEGCWYCHTLYVRETALDKRYGAPLRPGSYSGLSPALLGTERVGPDLTHVGGKLSRAQLVAFLSGRDKDATSRHLPSYAYLGERDLQALATFLLSLK